LARAALEEEQALAEDEAVEQERLRIGILGLEARRAIELRDVLQPRRIDARHRLRRRLVRAGPLPDRQLDRHAFGIHALGIQPDQRLQPVAGAFAIEARLLLDRGDTPLAPISEHAGEQRPAVAEAAVEAALGDAEVLRQHLDPDALDPRARQLVKSGPDPALAR